MALSTPRVNGWLRERLITDATLTALVGQRVYRSAVPETSPYPYVVFQLQAEPFSLTVLPATIIQTELLYVVKAIGFDPNYNNSPLVAIVDRVDALLHGASGSFGGRNVWKCVREREFQLDEPEGYMQLGAFYRVTAQ